MLAEELALTHRLTFTNLAVSGATVTSVNATQLPEAVRMRPHLASVIVGMNDTMRSTWDAARIRDEILHCVGCLAETGALVMTLRFHDHGAVLGLPRALRRPLGRRIEAVNAAYDLAHDRFGGLRLDLTASVTVCERLLWSVDRLHPSQVGHWRLAYEFGLLLQAMGYPLTCPRPAESPPRRWWQDQLWLVTQGVPWAGRRINDLVPWAIRMVAAEAATRVRARAA
jgi:hypothetical protein